MKRTLLLLSGAALSAGGAFAQDLSVEIELPRISGTEYHRPYVAVWISHPDQTVAANLAVWYSQKGGPEGKGETWLKDIRQWWRRTGRTLDMPVDGISSATRAPGRHTVSAPSADQRISGLKPGDYILHVEAAREVGGREMVSIPFTFSEETTGSLSAAGSSELGEVKLTLSATN